MAIGSRLPTHKEAVEIILMCIDRREARRQLEYMRQTQGDEFADSVAAKARAKWPKGKK